MTTVVSDTSPIKYLISIGEIDLLREFFDKILIPPAVYGGLQNPRTPPTVHAWAANLPRWAKVQRPSAVESTIGLGAGEVQAISLAIELDVPAILMD